MEKMCASLLDESASYEAEGDKLFAAARRLLDVNR